LEPTELELQTEGFISRFLGSNHQTRDKMRAEGRALADRLRREAIDLAMSKATEFSPKISLYFLLAAKAALLAYWPGAEIWIYSKKIFAIIRFLNLPRSWWRSTKVLEKHIPEIEVHKA